MTMTTQMNENDASMTMTYIQEQKQNDIDYKRVTCIIHINNVNKYSDSIDRNKQLHYKQGYRYI